ncbi:peptidyl-prolyl cis-trans isomerase sig-7 [Dendroctonus ponderosae]|uniref:Peptidyl-prolyl cis-trans isomerase n=1 Tax=Dendroctonus ponderosae TaxID=77166 RepID=J3JZD8_DENPD
MSVVIETTLGDITVDLYLIERPRACLNFLKLCKFKYYNFNLFHTISRGFIAQTGDPTGTRTKGESIFGVISGPSKRYFAAETEPRIKHTRAGLISFVGSEDNMIGSQFFVTLGADLTYLDPKHCVFGEIVEGLDILESINEVICDKDDRPYQDVRITHTVVLDDPYPDPDGFRAPSRSPSPSAERLAGGRIAPDEEIDETSGRSAQEVAEMQAEREAKARATILEMVGDIPDADMAPPENVLFVCKLNPVTSDDDLEIIFSRFGKIKSCEVIRDRKSGDSLQYAFIEFEEQKACEDAYFKMGNVLIDDRRIHVDFSQSVSKVKWLGKGRGVRHYDEKGNRSKLANQDIGNGNYTVKNRSDRDQVDRKERRRSRSPLRHRQDRSPIHDSNRRTKSRRKSRSPHRNRKRSVSSDSDTYENERRKRNMSPRRDKRYYSSSQRRRSRSRSRTNARHDNGRSSKTSSSRSYRSPKRESRKSTKDHK